jgi:hypothetical protein
MNNMKKTLFSILVLLCTLQISFSQVITFQPTTSGTGYLPSNNSSGGITFVIQNTNPYPAILNSLTYWNSVAATKDFTLWYSSSSISGAPTFPPTVAAGWNTVATVTGVAMAASVQSPIFTGLTFVIPANTTYRFFLISANVQYTGVTAPPNPSGVSPTTFTNTGVNFLVAEAQIAGQNVGWGGGNFSPRAFLGSATLTLLSTPCSGQPTAGVASASPTNPCPGTNITLSLTGSTAASGLAYQWQRANSPAGPWLTIPGATTNPYLYSPPTGSTTFYRCIVVCTNSGLNDTTVATSPAVVVQSWTPTSACYCNGIVSASTTNDIGQLTFGPLVNPSTAPSPQGSNPSATGTVTNLMSLTPIPNFVQALTYPINVFQISSAATLGTTWVKAWIDYNHNANFTDPGEEVFSSVSNAANSFTPIGSVTIPPTSLPGNTHMRVKMETGGSQATTTPCNNITTGEVEDYLINISPAGPYDPNVSAIAVPSSNCTGATETLTATICNYGSLNINLLIHPVTVTFKVIGPTGLSTYTVTLNSGTIPAFGASCVTATVTPVNLYAGGNYAINALVSCPTLPSGQVVNPSNDSLATAMQLFNYRPTASAPYELCQFNSIPFGQGLGVSGCSAPYLDTVTITFNLGICNDNIGSIGNGTSVGLPSNCSDQYACSFASATMPALPPGTTFVTPAVLKVTNLKENPLVPATVNTEMRLNIYNNNPIGPNLLSPGGLVPTVTTAGAVNDWTYERQISTNDLSNIFSNVAAGGSLNLGYWESYQDNTSVPDIALNSSSPSVATLTIYYQYVPAAFSWYDVPVGGSSLFSLSPFNPFLYPNAVVNNSNTPGTFTFYASCIGLPQCRVPVNLNINPTPAAFQDTLTACEYLVGANNAIFNLPSLNGGVSGNNLAASVAYFGDQSLLLPVLTPSNDTSSTNVIYSKVYYATTGCYSSDTVLLDVQSIPQFTQSIYTGFACAPNAIDISSLVSVFSPNAIDSFYYSDPLYTTVHPNPHAIYVADTVYMLVKTVNPVGCADSAVAYIDIIPATNYIANQAIGNFSTCGSIPCGNIALSEGNTETLYTTTDCRRIATVKDSIDGINLGNVSICEDIDCSVQALNGQPYVNRHYEITPTTNGKAQVCLYYLQQDFDDYNSLAFPSWPMMDPNQNLCITQVDNGDITAPGHTAISIPNTAISAVYDPLTTVWTVCFPVDSFSYFYCATCNPLNIPLPVSLLNFNAKRVNGVSELSWETSSEQNNSHFVVERSKDAKKFVAISPTINSKAINGNSSVNLGYAFTDESPMNTHNYYRLQQHDLDGHISYSGTIDVYFGNETTVSLYPNPVYTELNVIVDAARPTLTYVKISDATGRLVRTVETSLKAGSNAVKIDVQSLADGVYLVNVSNNLGLNYTKSIRKK